MNANDIQAMCALAAVLATLPAIALVGHLSRRRYDRKARNEPDKVRVSDTIWGPLGHFNVFQQDDDDVWSVEGVLTDETDMKTHSNTQATREMAVEHAKVLAGIAPFGPEEIGPVSITDRRGLVAHSRAQA